MATTAPVHDLPATPPKSGIALCLSGGGYRAMLFHLGSLWRLNDMGVLPKLTRISSVSGGSITSAVLGMNWKTLGVSQAVPVADKDKFETLVAAPVRKMASTTIDEGAVFGGLFLPGTVADHVADKYKSILFGDKTLQDLPSDAEGPRFVINATNVQSGKLMRFSKPYMRDWMVGQVLNPTLPLARAVGASSAFPPVLSPSELDISQYGLKLEAADGTEPLAKPPYTEKLFLTDGGVYDNLGLETAWKGNATVLVSDGGAHFQPDPAPHTDWPRHAYRILDIIDSQVRALRVRDLIRSYQQNERQGCYWSIATGAGEKSDTTIPCPADKTAALAATPTRLKAVDATLQERLINWGYLATDLAVRKRTNLGSPEAATALPYPASAI